MGGGGILKIILGGEEGGLAFRLIARTIQLDGIVSLDDVLIASHNCARSRKYPT